MQKTVTRGDKIDCFILLLSFIYVTSITHVHVARFCYLKLVFIFLLYELKDDVQDGAIFVVEALK